MSVMQRRLQFVDEEERKEIRQKIRQELESMIESLLQWMQQQQQHQPNDETNSNSAFAMHQMQSLIQKMGDSNKTVDDDEAVDELEKLLDCLNL